MSEDKLPKDPNAKKIKKVSVTSQAWALLNDYCLLEDGSYDKSRLPEYIPRDVRQALARISPHELQNPENRKKASIDFRRLCQSSSLDVFKAIEDIALDNTGTINEQTRIYAGEVIINRAYGSNKMTFVDLKGQLEGQTTEQQLDTIINATADGTVSVEIGKLLIDMVGRKAEIIQSEALMARMSELEEQLLKRTSPTRTINATATNLPPQAARAIPANAAPTIDAETVAVQPAAPVPEPTAPAVETQAPAAAQQPAQAHAAPVAPVIVQPAPTAIQTAPVAAQPVAAPAPAPTRPSWAQPAAPAAIPVTVVQPVINGHAPE